MIIFFRIHPPWNNTVSSYFESSSDVRVPCLSQKGNVLGEHSNSTGVSRAPVWKAAERN